MSGRVRPSTWLTGLPLWPLCCGLRAMRSVLLTPCYGCFTPDARYWHNGRKAASGNGERMDDDELIIWETTVPDAREGEVDHWHATLARPDANGSTWAYELMESPVLAEDWSTYQPFEPGSVVSLN